MEGRSGLNILYTRVTDKDSQIIDDNYPHALRVYQDTVTGAVRLQASVHRGDMDRFVARFCLNRDARVYSDNYF